MSISSEKGSSTILIVDDNPADVRLIKEAFFEIGKSPELMAVHSGNDAMAFLRRTGKWANATRPDLIILDIGLPGVQGGDVLSMIKSDSSLLTIPVIMFTNSSNTDDIITSYSNHANGYIVKPISFEDYIVTIRAIEAFWLQTVTLPN